MRLSIVALSLVFVAGAHEATPPEYVTKALELIESNAYYKGRIDWPKTKSEALESASRAKNIADTYDTIRNVIAALGDHHSSFRTPDFVANQEQMAATLSGSPTGSILDQRIGYIVVSQFGMADLAAIAATAQANGTRMASYLMSKPPRTMKASLSRRGNGY